MDGRPGRSDCTGCYTGPGPGTASRPRQRPRTRDSPLTQGKATDGATKTAVCAACHGPNGNSANPDWPRLAGQSAVYIAEQLHLFRSQVRPNPVMMPLAAALSDQDINDVAVYYEAQTPQGLEADPSYWQAGQALYLRGDTARNIPACVACHGPAVAAISPRVTRHCARSSRSTSSSS